MIYLVDTNTCIYFLNGKYRSVYEKFLSVSPSEIKISAIVKAELLLGAYKSQAKRQTLKKVERFLEPFEIIDFTDAMTPVYAEIRSDLELAGKKIGANDLLIAATAKCLGVKLVTHNVGEFSGVKGLKVADWVKA